jgi:RNA polymerase sigma-70 factor (ECF subfamily)
VSALDRDTAAGQGLEPHELEALAGAHAPALYRFSLSVTRDPQLAEDLVQETFVRALERGGQYRGEAAPVSWLRRILFNLAIDRSRRHGRELPVEEVEESWRDDAYTVDSQAVVEQAETREELEDALIRLPFIYRAALVLHDVEGLTASEIADAQGIGLSAAKQRLRRGRMMLISALAGSSERREALKGVPLRCWDARRDVSDYIDDELRPERRAVLERHIKSCPTCPPLYAALVGVKATLGGLRDPDSVIPPNLVEKIIARREGKGGHGQAAV